MSDVPTVAVSFLEPERGAPDAGRRGKLYQLCHNFYPGKLQRICGTGSVYGGTAVGILKGSGKAEAFFPALFHDVPDAASAGMDLRAVSSI